MDRQPRQLLDAIAGFRESYQGDAEYKDVLAELDQVEEHVETLSGGPEKPDVADKARTLPEAAAKSREIFKRAKQDQSKP